MSYSENGSGTNFTMPVQPFGGNGYGGDFFGGNGAWWLIILLLFANNGWGNGFGFGGGGMMANVNNDVQRGFDQSAIMGSLNGITSAISNGFANAEISRCNANTNVLQALNTNQAATISGMNGLAMNLQNCCCENRAGLADLKYTVATENCADRTALNEGLTSMMMANNANTQAIVNATNAGIQTVMDKICQLELAGKDQQIAALTAQLNEANRLASQAQQTATIQAGQRALANEIEQYVLPTPRPAYVVQNPNCCTQNQNCCAQNTGCGCMC